MSFRDCRPLSLKRQHFLRLASWIVGIVLLGAGLLKLSAAFTEAYHFGFPPYQKAKIWLELTFAISALEIGLGILLVNHHLSRPVWYVTAAAFSIFFVASLLEGLADRRSCDCFGTVIVRPYYTTALDLAMIATSVSAIFLLRGADSEIWSGKRWQSAFILPVFFLSLFGFLYVREASEVTATLGLPRVVGSMRVNETPGESPAELLEGTLLLGSRGARSMAILGMERSCALHLKTEFPIDISGYEGASIPFILRRPAEGTIGRVPITFFVSDGDVLRLETLNLRLNQGMFN